MKKFNQSLVVVAMLASLTPVAASAATTAITNVKVYTSTEQGVLDSATVVIEDGKIISVNAEQPNDTVVIADNIINAQGSVLTPGFIGSMNYLGLVEIGQEKMTRDVNAKDADISFDPSLAFNPKSSAIAFARKGGISRNIVVPGGGESIFSGQAIEVELTGHWDSVVATEKAVLVQLGAVHEGSRIIGMQQLINKLEARQTALAADKQADAKKADATKPPSKEELLLNAVLAGDITMVVDVDRASDILQLINLKARFNLDLVLLKAADAIVVAEQLAAANIPVVMDAMRNLPESFDSLHNSLDNAGKLSKAGVKVILATPGDAHGIYGLRYAAGNAVANGMDYNQAMASITANVADIFHLDAGRIATGKPADMVLWSGDPFEYSSAIQTMWINGEVQNMQSRQDELRDRYIQKSTMPQAYTQ
ncbi:amidohydrolase family protein [Shewanella sp. 3_MG-2023]|uniref:amidohydrolase family protein n=1 Tax=Shewanella sp. 3_MG-2023 TaxID=3062635 RepID=UPI0026E28B92|nr:amidohydrolase family protein [Shewanella sp. 3_MG-2023]MDO6777594.1 amidohydrolase family protein [Shewanella sp. 3_MG-2023]